MNATEETQIWNGDPGQVSGSTVLGIYDDDLSFQSDSPKIAKQIAKNLGYPMINVELDSGSIYSSIEESILEFSTLVNEYNIQDNIFVLKGASSGSNLSGRNVADNFGRTIELTEKYGVEVGVNGDVDYRRVSIDVTESVQTYNLDELIADVYESGSSIEIRRVHHYRNAISPFGIFPMMNHMGFTNMAISISH
jgi:hypothetical protein